MVNLIAISMMVFDNEEQVMCSSTTRLEKASIINLIFDVYDDVNHVYDDGVDEDPTSDILDEEIDASFIGIQEVDGREVTGQPRDLGYTNNLFLQDDIYIALYVDPSSAIYNDFELPYCGHQGNHFLRVFCQGGITSEGDMLAT
ncbi:hypothetical protein Bca4012_049184 [Brassica carinata]